MALPSPRSPLDAEFYRLEQAVGKSEMGTAARIETAVAQARAEDRTDLWAWGMILLASQYVLDGRLVLAQHRYGEALALARRSALVELEARALNGLGVAAIHLGNYREAASFYRQSLKLAREHRDLAGIARTLNNMALMWSRLGQTERALDDLSQAQELFLRVQHPVHTFVVAFNLIWALIQLRHYERASTICTIYLSLAEEHDLPGRFLEILCAQAACQAGLGRRKEALRTIAEAQRIEREHPEYAGDTTNALLLGLACADLEDTERAIHFLQQAVQYALNPVNLDMLAQAHLALSRLHHQQGDHAAAYDHSWAYFSVREQMFPLNLMTDTDDLG